jgi:hypothetical protein
MLRLYCCCGCIAAAAAVLLLLLLLPHSLTHSITLQDSLPHPPQISLKLWPLLEKNKKAIFVITIRHLSRHKPSF